MSSVRTTSNDLNGLIGNVGGNLNTSSSSNSSTSLDRSTASNDLDDMIRNTYLNTSSRRGQIVDEIMRDYRYQDEETYFTATLLQMNENDLNAILRRVRDAQFSTVRIKKIALSETASSSSAQPKPAYEMTILLPCNMQIAIDSISKILESGRIPTSIVIDMQYDSVFQYMERINKNLKQILEVLKNLPINEVSLNSSGDSIGYLSALNMLADIPNLRSLGIKNIEFVSGFNKDPEYLKNLWSQLTSLTLDYVHMTDLCFIEKFENLENLTLKKEDSYFLKSIFLDINLNARIKFSPSLKNITIMECVEISQRFEEQLRNAYPEINFNFFSNCNFLV